MPSSIAAASTNGLNVEPAWKPAESPYFVGHHVVEEGLALLLAAAHRPGLGDRLHVAGARARPSRARRRPGRARSTWPVTASSAASWSRRSMRGADGQAAGLEQLAALRDGLAERRVVEQVVPGVVAEERGAGEPAAVLGRDDLEAELRLLGLVRLLAGDDVELGHPVEHDVAARQGPVGGVGRVVAGGVLHQAGEHRGLPQVELLGVDAEVVAGGRLDAVRAVTEVGDVEVALEDPVLGVLLLERDRVAELA